jgi:glycosyltransferase involved in cell wall biosynthesis
MEDGAPWPKISIVTPSYNQGEYLEETIRSILLQGYGNLEYIIIDGASRDQSVEVIKKYEPWLAFWVSEPHREQPQAVNKGLAHATGEIFNWINSDDLLTPGALGSVARQFEGADMVAGGNIIFGVGRRDQVRHPRGLTARDLLRFSSASRIEQQTMWVRRSNVEACGRMDEDLYLAFDVDFYIRYLHFFPRVSYVEAPLAKFRKHERSKTESFQALFPHDRLATAQKLLQDPRFEPLHEDCLYAKRVHEWRILRGDIINSDGSAQWVRALAVLLHALADPPVRMERATLRAAKKLLLGRLEGQFVWRY